MRSLAGAVLLSAALAGAVAGAVAEAGAQVPTQASAVQVDPELARVELSLVEREWRRRRWALDPMNSRGHGEELVTALRSADWRERFDAVDALTRTAAGARWSRLEPQRSTIVALARDEHPNVRARSFALGVHADIFGAMIEARAPHVMEERFPDAQMELARAWALTGADPDWTMPMEVWDQLADWEAFGGEELSNAAFVALAVASRPQHPRSLSWLFDSTRGPRGERWRRALALLERLPLSAGALEGWRSAVRRDGRHPAGAASLELVALRCGLEADFERLEEDLPALLAHELWRAELLATAELRPSGLADFLWRAFELERGRSRSNPEREAFLIECASAASPAWEAISRARTFGFEPEAALELWRMVRARMTAWEPEEGAYWLSSERGREQRLLAFQVLAAVPAVRLGPEAREQLFDLAADGDAVVAENAFRRLCNPGEASDPSDLAELDTRLFEIWSGYEPSERLKRLRELRRDVPMRAFRDELAGLGRVSATRSTSVIELLGAFVGDEEIARDLRAWLDEALGRLEAHGPGHVSFRTTERRARSLLAALKRVDGDAALDGLLAVWGRSVAWVREHGEPTLELAETAAHMLGSYPRGAQELARDFDQLPERLRTEAALALVRGFKDGGTPGPAAVKLGFAPARAEAVHWLAESYSSFDPELRHRTLVACAAWPDSSRGRELLRFVAEDSRQDWEHRSTAMSALAQLGEREVLERLFFDGTDVALRLAALSAIASVPGDATSGFLTGLTAELAAGGLAARPETVEEDEYALLYDEVLLLRAARGASALELRDAWLRRARARARPDLWERFLGTGIPAAGFRWQAELALARRFAAAGELEQALPADWYELDGDLLLALAEAATAQEPETAVVLLRGALVAYAGQPAATETEGRVLAARLRLLRVAEGLEGSDALAETSTSSRQLLAADRLGSGILGFFERSFGGRDQARGVDPRGRIASSGLQAASRASLLQGDLAAARRWAEAARRAVGYSRAALRRQAALEEILSESSAR